MNQRIVGTAPLGWACLPALLAAVMLHGPGRASAITSPPRSVWDPTSWWSHATDPIIPPPLQVFLRDFSPLYRGYQAIPNPKFCTFSEWLVMHGVVEPERHRAMMALYALFEGRTREW